MGTTIAVGQVARVCGYLSTWRPFTFPMYFFCFSCTLAGSQPTGRVLKTTCCSVEKSMNYCASWFVDLPLLGCQQTTQQVWGGSAGESLNCHHWVPSFFFFGCRNGRGNGGVLNVLRLAGNQIELPPFQPFNPLRSCEKTVLKQSRHDQNIPDFTRCLIYDMKLSPRCTWLDRLWRPEIVRYSCCWRNLFASAVFGRTWPTAWCTTSNRKINGLVLLLQALRYEILQFTGWYTGVILGRFLSTEPRRMPGKYFWLHHGRWISQFIWLLSDQPRNWSWYTCQMILGVVLSPMIQRYWSLDVLAHWASLKLCWKWFMPGNHWTEKPPHFEGDIFGMQGFVGFPWVSLVWGSGWSTRGGLESGQPTEFWYFWFHVISSTTCLDDPDGFWLVAVEFRT